MDVKVSVVIPVCNAGRFLDETIDSIQAQTFSAWEIVAVDDGSTDDSLQILRQRASADSRIRVYAMEAPSGSAFEPRTRAISLARGQFVLPVDADDVIAPDFIERAVAMQQATGADEVLGLLVRLEPPHECVTPWQEKNCPDGTVLTGRECVALTLNGWRIGCAGNLVRRDLMLEASKAVSGSDVLICTDELVTRLQLSKMRKVAFTTSQYFYQSVQDSVTRRRSLKLFDYLRVNCALIDMMRDLYGVDSEEYALAHCQNFYGVFEAYRLRRRQGFDRAEFAEVLTYVDMSRDKVDYDVIRGRVSPRYYALMRQRILPFGPCLRLADTLLAKN